MASPHDAQPAPWRRRCRRRSTTPPSSPVSSSGSGASVDGVLDWLQARPGALGQWVKDHANVIAEIADVLSELAAVMGFVALFLPPPANAILGGIAALTALGGLVGPAVADAAGVEIPVSTCVRRPCRRRQARSA